MKRASHSRLDGRSKLTSPAGTTASARERPDLMLSISLRRLTLIALGTAGLAATCNKCSFSLMMRPATIVRLFSVESSAQLYAARTEKPSRGKAVVSESVVSHKKNPKQKTQQNKNGAI